jgi:Flp pilus assembly pilin Flp
MGVLQLGHAPLRVWVWCQLAAGQVRPEEGQGITEYALVVGALAALVIASSEAFRLVMEHVFSHSVQESAG